jgi:hypothetical protein
VEFINMRLPYYVIPTQISIRDAESGLEIISLLVDYNSKSRDEMKRQPANIEIDMTPGSENMVDRAFETTA